MNIPVSTFFFFRFFYHIGHYRVFFVAYLIPKSLYLLLRYLPLYCPTPFPVPHPTPGREPLLFLMTHDVEHLSTVYLSSNIIFVVKCLFKYFAHFLSVGFFNFSLENNQPQYMYAPSLVSLPPISHPPHPSRLSESTGASSLGHTAKSRWLSVLHMVVSREQSLLLSQFIPPSTSSTVPPSLFSVSTSPLLPCKKLHQYHLSRFYT